MCTVGLVDEDEDVALGSEVLWHVGAELFDEVALSLVDESVFYIQSDYAGDPRQFYFGTKRAHQIQTQATMNQKSYAKLVVGEKEELIEQAVRLGLDAIASTGHDGFYGVVRFAEAARAVGMPTVFGTEITLTPGLVPHQQMMLSEEATTTQVVTGRVPDSHAPDPPAPLRATPTPKLSMRVRAASAEPGHVFSDGL